MKSIKPGRGPSMMGAFVSACAALFGVIWMIIALQIGGGIFALFGVIFILIAVANLIYNYKNATGKRRFSIYDITDSEEEPDPMHERIVRGMPPFSDKNEEADVFCPYCGTALGRDFIYCKKCGKKQP